MTHTDTQLGQHVTQTWQGLGQKQCRWQSCLKYDVCSHFGAPALCVEFVSLLKPETHITDDLAGVDQCVHMIVRKTDSHGTSLVHHCASGKPRKRAADTCVQV